MKNVITKIFTSLAITSLLIYYAMPAFAYINEETIYSKLDNSGNSYTSIVTTITEDKNGTKTAQNETDEELPVTCNITYYLNEKEMELDEIVGKKGRVTIKLEYTNNSKNEVEVNENVEEMYTPFVVISGVVLDNEKNRNVDITNGKIITNGNSSIAIGIAVPGLQESLALDEEDIEIPSSIEISMDTDSFELGNIITYYTPKALSDLDIKVDDFDEIFSKVDELQSSSHEIEDGASTLSDGISVLSDGATSLENGVNSLDAGINSLQAGTNELNNGASSLKSGAQAVTDNLGTIANGLTSVQNGANSLKSGEAELSSGLDTIVSSLEAQVDASTSAETEASLAGMQSVIDSNYNLMQTLPGVISSLQAQMDSLSEDDATRATLQIQIDTYNQMLSLATANYQALSGAKQTIDNTSTQIGTLYNGLVSVKDGMNSIVEGTNSLSSGIDELASGANTLAEKSGELVSGADSLQAGTSSLVSGVNTLSAGSKELKSGSSTLSNGTIELVDGSNALLSGIKQFNEEGIDTICDFINNEFKTTLTRFEKLQELSEEYNKFYSDEKRDEVNFVNITDSVKVPSSDEEKKNK